MEGPTLDIGDTQPIDFPRYTNNQVQELIGSLKQPDPALWLVTKSLLEDFDEEGITHFRMLTPLLHPK